MEFLSIPTGSLQRDEIYSLLGATFVAISYFLVFKGKVTDIDNTKSKYCIFIAITFTLFLVFILNALFIKGLSIIESNDLRAGLECIKTKSSAISKLKEVINMNTVTGFQDIKAYQDMFYTRQIKSIMFVSLVLSAIPFFYFVWKLRQPTFNLLTTKLCISLLYIGVILMTLCDCYKTTREIYAIHFLRVEHVIDIYDLQKYAERRAEYFADFRRGNFQPPQE